MRAKSTVISTPPDERVVISSAPPPEITLDGLLVLVVDAPGGETESLAAVLSGAGATVRVCHATSTALQEIERILYDVVLVGIDHTGPNSLALALSVRGSPDRQHIGLIALTPWWGIEQCGRAITAGFDYLLSKPAAPVELVAVVAAHRLSRGQAVAATP